MKRYLIVKSAVFLTVFLAAFSPFFLLDPFKILYRYDHLYESGHDPHIDINRDYASTETYLKNRKEIKYNSYIFGNSRSLAFLSRDWAQYLDGAVGFHFDSYGESLYGIWTKIRFIDKLRDNIKHSLILLDKHTLRKADHDGHIFIKDPRTSSNSWVYFYLMSTRAYFSNFFFIKYLDFTVFREYRPYMRGSIIAEDIILRYDPITNDPYFVEDQRGENGGRYRVTHEDRVPRRATGKRYSGSVIGQGQLSMLKDIRYIFRKHSTDYRIIISPLYDQIYFDEKDLRILRDIFGAKNVYDYSGVNGFTGDIDNYFENSHYRPWVAREILRQIYVQGKVSGVRPMAPGDEVYDPDEGERNGIGGV